MSEGPVVLLSASLRGANGQAQCDVLVRKTANMPNSVSKVGAPAYSNCSIVSAPADLPDGEYDVRFEGHFVTATKEYGVWLVREPVCRSRN